MTSSKIIYENDKDQVTISCDPYGIYTLKYGINSYYTIDQDIIDSNKFLIVYSPTTSQYLVIQKGSRIMYHLPATHREIKCIMHYDTLYVWFLKNETEISFERFATGYSDIIETLPGSLISKDPMILLKMYDHEYDLRFTEYPRSLIPKIIEPIVISTLKNRLSDLDIVCSYSDIT